MPTVALQLAQGRGERGGARRWVFVTQELGGHRELAQGEEQEITLQLRWVQKSPNLARSCS